MKVGILTKHSVPNYGAMLQAYASCAYLNEQGINTELIDYDQPATTEYYRFKWTLPPNVNHWLRLKRAADFVRDKQKKCRFHCTGADGLMPHLKDYTHLITGSDQVWFTGPVQYYDPMYFLDFSFSHGTKISYAPSAGGIDSFGEFEPRVRNAVNDIRHLSVRDSNTASLVSKLTGREPTLVVDPTLLHHFKDLVSETPPQPEPYLLLFGKIPDSYAKLVADEAKAQGIRRIVSLQYANAIATHRVAAPSPQDWLNHFYHAEKVVTTYFHGSVFAIKFNKPFLSIPTQGRIKKVTSLLADAGLSDRGFVGEPDLPRAKEKLSAPVDWASALKGLNTKIDSSKRFLESALS
ncbi:MAG: polysaccharide pyruvyl transferase family protein [Opitutaceae bacterium]|nr:polysaccharide pyruvyl transferase family protein [Opitutaceae bacterium]